MDNPTHISILGGGLAGLAVGYYAKKNGIPFTIYEARNRLGGDCITLKKEGFLFDSGAHRLHDQDPEITQEMRNLLGDALQRVDIPSKIYAQGKFLHFPLSLTGLLENLGLFTIVKAAVEVGISRLAKRNLNKSFESFAVYAYGSDIAERFLLNYSEKLWGAPCARLSSTIAGKRLQGITAKSLMAGIFLGRKAMDKHVEGAFHYPKMGIGVIAEKLGEFCGEKTIVKDAKITKILHDDGRIRAIEVNGKKEIATDEVVSTLSLPFFFACLEATAAKGHFGFSGNLSLPSTNISSIIFGQRID